MNPQPGDIWIQGDTLFTVTPDGRVIAARTERGVTRVAIAEKGPDGKPQGESFVGTPGAARRWLLEHEEQKP